MMDNKMQKANTKRVSLAVMIKAVLLPLLISLLLTGLPFRTASADTVPINPITIDFPAPLSAADIGRYQQIFALQHDKNWQAADKVIANLDNDLLMGRVLAQRYLHPTGWRSTYKELRTWLDNYNDHPAASRLYWLSKKRKPENAKTQKSPKNGYLNGYGRSSLGRSYVRIPASTSGRAAPAKTRQIARDIRRNIRKGWPSGGRNLLNKDNLRYLTKYEEAVLRGDIAHGYFIYGKDQNAISQAKQAIAIAGSNVPQAYWTAGIAAWRSGDVPLALTFFHVLAVQDKAPSALTSAAAYWASRGELRLNNVDASFRFLDIASRYQDTFYGTLAAEALGQDITLDFTLPTVTPSFLNWLNNAPGGRRMFGLLQVGETYHASREMRYLWESMTDEQHLQAMSFAAKTHMAGMSFRTADIIRHRSNVYYYGGLYPIPDFETNAPIRIDQSLLLAIMRQESGFNPRAKSSAKASGLLQLMPATAAFITRDASYRGSRRHDLMIPGINIKIAEDYILHLLKERLIDNNMVKLLAAYNGGPGNLNKWTRRVNHGGDTLMLLESLPSRETRFYVKNVMTNFWIYSKRLNQDATATANLAATGNAYFKPFSADGGTINACVLTKLSERCK